MEAEGQAERSVCEQISLNEMNAHSAAMGLTHGQYRRRVSSRISCCRGISNRIYKMPGSL